MSEQDTQLRIFKELYGYEWPNCLTPDCPNKECTWAYTRLCAPCSLRRVGPEKMIALYNESHPDTPWTESFPPGGKPVPMLKDGPFLTRKDVS